MQTLTVKEIDAFSKAIVSGKMVAPMNVLRLCNLCKDYVQSMQEIEDLKNRAQQAIVQTLARAEEMVTDRAHRRSLEREVTKIKAQMSQREEWIESAKTQSAILENLSKRLQDITEAATLLMGEIEGIPYFYDLENKCPEKIGHTQVYLNLDLLIHPETETRNEKCDT